MKQILNRAASTLALGATMMALALLAPPATRAAEQMKGGQHLIHLNSLKTVADVEALKADDTFAMACAKCKTIFVARVVKSAKGAEVLAAGGKPTQIIGLHPCSGCGSTIEITGHGKGKESKLKHTCKTCGDESAFCCASKSEGAKGKEEHKH